MLKPARTADHVPQHSPPGWMQRAQRLIAGATVLLCLLIVGMLLVIQSGGTVSVFERAVNPTMDPALDPGWIPATWILLTWILLTACTLLCWRSERERTMRISARTLGGALLATMGLSVLLSASMSVPWPDYRPPVRVDLGYGLCTMAAVVSAASLIRLVLVPGRTRGVWLAMYALAAPIAGMFWVHVFLVAPAIIQPIDAEKRLELAVIRAPQMVGCLLPEEHRIEIVLNGKAARVHVLEAAGSSGSWRADLHAMAQEIPLVALGEDPTAKKARLEDLVILADARLSAGTVLAVAEAAQDELITGLLFAAREASTGIRSALVVYQPLHELPQERVEGLLEVRPGQAGAASSLQFSLGELVSQSLSNLLQRAPMQRDGILRIGVHADLSWQQVMEVTAKVQQQRSFMTLELLAE